MTETKSSIFKLTDGMGFSSGPDSWWLEPLTLNPGVWAALVPTQSDAAVDPAGNLARILATLSMPTMGTVELLGRNIARLSYREIQRLRARFGFVQGYGGLLSNRTIAGNISLPLSVHGNLSFKDEKERLDSILKDFALEQVADLRPHDMDGATRWRACVARSLVLNPDWLVLEGIGDWEMDRGRGVSWTRIVQYKGRHSGAAAICLSRRNPQFEAWFVDHGGVVIEYSRKSVGAHEGEVRR